MRIILDCDPGNGIPGSDVDDGLALGLILKSPEMELLAVTTVAGNTKVDDGVRCAFAVLEAAGAAVAVHRGAPQALLEAPGPWRRELDGRGEREPAAGFWRGVPRPEPVGTPARGCAAEAIVRLVNEHPGEVTIVAIGPLTNVAQAIMIDPALPGKVKRISIMGGAFGVPHLPQELNFGYDPEAARIVVASGARITLVPLDTTLRTSFLPEDNARLSASADGLARFLGETTAPWIRYVSALRKRAGCPLHDPLAVALLLDPSLVDVERVCVDVELSGRLTRGRPVSWRPENVLAARGLVLPDVPPIDVVVDVRNDRLVEMIVERLLAGSARQATGR